MTRALRVFVIALLFVSCRSTRPTGSPVAPLTAATSEEAMAQLRARRDSFEGLRSLMKVRATTNGKTQSFRAQLHVQDARRMELIAYTPVGTTALTLRADGDAITSDPEVAPASFAFLRNAGLTPAETAMLLLGIPPRDDLQYDVAVTGLRSATAAGVTVTYDPPSFPAQKVVVTRGDDRVEIEHLEVVR
ncbi:MAG TPA: DUF3261 domain-containing protein [Thermoanaerobaculia bacterium]|nr:DUF3261 domain-containing protein [Thermoanaerobaculia bacterium]